LDGVAMKGFLLLPSKDQMLFAVCQLPSAVNCRACKSGFRRHTEIGKTR